MYIQASRIQNHIEYLVNRGVNSSPLYKQLGISKEELKDRTKMIDFEHYRTLLDFALRQTNDIAYGLDFGKQPQLGGTISMMGASCKNLRESFVEGSKFFKAQGDFADMQFVDDKEYPKLVYKLLQSWVIESPQTARLDVDIMFSFINTVLKVNSNNTVKPYKLHFAFPKPTNTEKYFEIFGINPVFDTRVNEMIFHSDDLSIPMKAFNPETYQLLNQYLQTRLDHLSHSEKVTDKVKRILHSSFKYQFPDIETVAGKLSLSSRTLQRKLSEEQTSFKDILQETLFGIAKQLLLQDHLSVSEISDMLGYSDLGNFSRSFKKYVGNSPIEYKVKESGNANSRQRITH
jgi:AraC-like DNA-binding protein